jgi:hypothetical protein
MKPTEIKNNLNNIVKNSLQNIRRILANEGLKAVNRSKEMLLDNKNFSSGRLYKSISADLDGNKLEFGTNVPYAITIETGFSFNSPNVNDIREWAKRKVKLGHVEKDILYHVEKITDNINNSGRIKHWRPFIEPSFAIMVKDVKEQLKDAIIQ